MPKKIVDDGRSLFDGLDPEVAGLPAPAEAIPVPVEEAIEPAPRLPWREVPQALFLSWPEKKRLLYCAARDRDAATLEDNKNDAAWFLDRAASYQAIADKL